MFGAIRVDGNFISDEPFVGADCFAENGYDDVRAGAQVVLATDAGATLAAVSLQAGRIPVGEVAVGDSVPSDFPFDFGQVNPGTGKFFSMTVGHRDGPKLTRAELDKPIRLNLGA